MSIYELLPTVVVTPSGAVIEKLPKLIGFFDREVPVGSIDGINSTFVLTNTPIQYSEHIYLNGLLQEPGRDYNLSGNLIIFDSDSLPQPGDLLQASGRYKI